MLPDIDNSIDKSTDACIAKEETFTQETNTPTTDQSFIVSEAEWVMLKALLDKRYNEIAALLRYNKTKDESIQRLSTELQNYRDGFAFSALKPFINALITLREDCRKSIRDSKQFTLDNEKVKKYMEYLISDFEEMLSNIGLERNNNSITINGKPLSGLTQPKVFPTELITNDQKEVESSQTMISSEQIKNIPALIDYLNKNETIMRLALQDRTTADKTIQKYIELSAHTDAEHYLALVAPISRQLFALYDSISAKNQSISGYSGEALLELYNVTLEKVVSGIGVILTNAGMVIETLEGIFDTQKHKLIKTIPTSDEKLDRVIANTYTDCYTYDGKVVYQSKVDVYKFQDLTQGEQNRG